MVNFLYCGQDILNRSDPNVLKYIGPKTLYPRCSWGCSENTILVNELSQSVGLFLQNFKNYKSQTVRARDLTFERMFTPHNMSHVTSHVSSVTCHMSHVTCHMTHVICHLQHVMCHFFSSSFLDKVVKLIGGWCVINRAYPSKFVKWARCF